MISKRLLGVLMLIASPFVIAYGYGSLPDAQTCAFVSNMNEQLGGPALCSSSPATWYWVLTAVLAAVGIVLIVTNPPRG